MSGTATSIPEAPAVSRSYADWSSPKGFNTESVPWRLWEKAKALHWNPADLDFSQDVKDWQRLGDEQRLALAGLARGFMVGEEGVTLDILPLTQAMADEGRVEDVMFLTTFMYEEAKHIDFFRRWFDALGIDLAHLQQLQNARMRARGLEPPDPKRTTGMFESELPKVMRRLVHDHSPQALMDATVTYNQFVEGCLALAGYKVWGEMFKQFEVMPGLQAGLAHVRVDESRHITYGTYLARRTVAENPELLAFARDRMYELRDWYFTILFPRAAGQEAAGQEAAPGAEAVSAPPGEERPAPGPLDPDGPFSRYARNQVDRRVSILERAALLTTDEAELGTGAEEAEAEAEEAAIPVGA